MKRHITALRNLSSDDLNKHVRLTIKEELGLHPLILTLSMYGSENFWQGFGYLTHEESAKLFESYMQDSYVYMTPICVIRHSRWDGNWNFVKPLDTVSRIAKASKFLNALDKSHQETFARTVIKGQKQFVFETEFKYQESFYPNTRNRDTVLSGLKHKQQLSYSFQVECAPLYRSGVSLAFIPFFDEIDKFDVWVVNHSKLNAYILRTSYCSRCSRKYVCDIHMQPIHLIPIIGTGWDSLKECVVKCLHLISFDGLSVVKSLLFLQKIFGSVILKEPLRYRYKPDHPVRVCKVTCMRILQQQEILYETFLHARPILDESANVTSLNYENRDALVESMIRDLKYSHARIQSAYHQKVPMVIYARVVDDIYVFRWREDGFLQCNGIKHSGR